MEIQTSILAQELPKALDMDVAEKTQKCFLETSRINTNREDIQKIKGCAHDNRGIKYAKICKIFINSEGLKLKNPSMCVAVASLHVWSADQ